MWDKSGPGPEPGPAAAAVAAALFIKLFCKKSIFAQIWRLILYYYSYKDQVDEFVRELTFGSIFFCEIKADLGLGLGLLLLLLLLLLYKDVLQKVNSRTNSSTYPLLLLIQRISWQICAEIDFCKTHFLRGKSGPGPGPGPAAAAAAAPALSAAAAAQGSWF